jgi:hypothetical protein
MTFQADQPTLQSACAEVLWQEFPFRSITPSHTKGSSPLSERATNSAAAGPAGPQFEVRVGAAYLLALAAEASPRALPGATVTRVAYQRSARGHPMDDIVVTGRLADGADAFLDIQAKRTIDFTKSETEFGAVVAQIVATANMPGFWDRRHEVAVAIARTSTKIERDYQRLLAQARSLSSGADLRALLTIQGLATPGMRDFEAAFRAHLMQIEPSADDNRVLALLRRLHILVFDFENTGSATMELVRERAGHLVGGNVAQAEQLWTALVDISLRLDADGGEVDVVELRRRLGQENSFTLQGRLSLVPAQSFLSSISSDTLAAIKDDIDGARLLRPAPLEAVETVPDQFRYIELRGERGSGKSGVLKRVAIQERLEGQSIVLDNQRLPGGGWSQLAHLIDTTSTAREFLADLAASGGATLFIDGIDFIEGDKRATVTDLLIAAAEISSCRVIATARTDFSPEDRMWMPDAALRTLGRKEVAVADLDDDDIAALGTLLPRLALLLQSERALPITRNLFQLQRTLALGDSEVPAGEAALARQWWERGGEGGSDGQHARIVSLRALGDQSISSVRDMEIASLDGGAVDALRQFDVLSITVPGSRAVFRHDVLRDWAIGNYLYDDPPAVTRLPLGTLAPPDLRGGLEIAGRLSIEKAIDVSRWLTLLGLVSAQDVHGSWRRQVLLALVRCEDWRTVLDRAQDALYADSGALLRDLMGLVLSVETRSIRQELIAAGMPDETMPRTIVVPTNYSWPKLIAWLLMNRATLPGPVCVEAVNFFYQWLVGHFGRGDLAAPILQAIYEWLVELEGRHDRLPEAPATILKGLNWRAEGGLESELRSIFLVFCGPVPCLADEYLRAKAGAKQRYGVDEEILKLSRPAATAAPVAMADFTRTALMKRDDDDDPRYPRVERSPFNLRFGELGPASPTAGPFAALLEADEAVGLTLIHDVVDRAAGFIRDDRKLTLWTATGRRYFSSPASYLMSRQGDEIERSALLALEAWAHKQVEAGRAIEDVVGLVIGQGTKPSALLAVAIDLMLSHWPASAEALWPYAASPELLQHDSERGTLDQTGFRRLFDSGRQDAALDELTARPSRSCTLLDLLDQWTVRGPVELHDKVEAVLREEQVRIHAEQGNEIDGFYSVQWSAQHALNRMNMANWAEVTAENDDGTLTKGHMYRAPAEENAIVAAPRAKATENLSETAMQIGLQKAVEDPALRTRDMLGKALTWAQDQDAATLSAATEFEDQQRWRAMVTTAAFAHHLGKEAEQWSRDILNRALTAPREGLRNINGQIIYNAKAIGLLGLLLRVDPGDCQTWDAVLPYALDPDAAELSAFAQVIPALTGLGLNLPRSLIRLGLLSAVHPAGPFDADDEQAIEAKAAYRARLENAVAGESAWLGGQGREPAWPVFPKEPVYERNRSITLSPIELEPAAEPARPETYLDGRTAAVWLNIAVAVEAGPEETWLNDLVLRFFEWTLHANGAGLEAHAEVNEPSEWNDSFYRHLARVAVGMDDAELETGVLAPLCALPDDSFFDAAGTFLRASDVLCILEGRPEPTRLARMRTIFAGRIKSSREWRWRDEVSNTLSTDFAPAARAMFLHEPISIGPLRCYLPRDRQDILHAVLPLLAGLSHERPGSGYLSALFLNLMEQLDAVELIPVAISTAAAWLAVRPDDATFWRDHDYGRRFCIWASERWEEVRRLKEENQGAYAEFSAIVDGLVRLGIAEASPLEARMG